MSGQKGRIFGSILATILILSVLISSGLFGVSAGTGYVLTQLTDTPGVNDIVPSISGNGEKVVWQSNYNYISIINSGGSNKQELAFGWSPSINYDGSKIAYTGQVGVDDEIFVMNSDGTNKVQLTALTGDNYYASISADGSKIAFQHQYNINPDQSGLKDIYVVSSAGSLTLLASGVGKSANDRGPCISADGSKVVFAAGLDDNYNDIWIVNADGGGLAPLATDAADDDCPSISADGSKVAFRSSRTGSYDLFIVNSDGTGLQHLTYAMGNIRDPLISTGGSLITFASNYDGNNEIYLTNLYGNVVQLTTTSSTYNNYWPSISADGLDIAFVRNIPSSGEYEIFALSAQAPSGLSSLSVTANMLGSAPVYDWTYVLMQGETIVESFTLPGVGGSISFPSLNPGTYYLAQTRKYSYHLDSITVDAVEVQPTHEKWADSLTLELLPDTTTNVVFTNAFGEGPSYLTVDNVLSEGSVVPTTSWSYLFTYPDGTVDDFTLPADGGSISFELTALGSYSLAQTHKDGYDTSFIVDDSPPVMGDVASISVTMLGEGFSVLFGNSMQREQDPNYVRIDVGKHIDGLDYVLPANKIIPIQAAWAADAMGNNPEGTIDLVTGKPTQIVVNLQLDPAVPADWGHLDIYVSGIGSIPSKQIPHSVYDPVSNPTAFDPVLNPNVFILTTPLTPTTGSYDLVGYYRVNDNAAQYPLVSTHVVVKDTSPLGLYYTTLSRSSDYGTETSTAYTETVTKSNDFIKATFPFNPNTMKADTTWSSRTKVIAGSVKQPNANDQPEKGMSIDCTNVALAAYNAYRKSGISYRGVGIGPMVSNLPYATYFAYHGIPDAGGIRFPGVKGVVVLDGCWDAAAHELGHTYGLYVPTVADPTIEEEYVKYQPDGLTASGVSVLEGKWATGYDFMSYCHFKELDSTWVTTSTYNALFSAMATNPSDPPEVLWASGTINIDPLTGKFSVETNTNDYRWYQYDAGLADELDPNGEFGLVFLDTAGNPIGDPARFAAYFTMQVDPVFRLGQDINVEGYGTREITFAPFAFATALPAGTAKVKVYEFIDDEPTNDLATVEVRDIAYAAGFSGFIGLKSGDTYKVGTTIPLKFQLLDQGGNYITTATATCFVAKVTNGVAGTFVPATSTSTPKNGNLFRYDLAKDQYVYNLDTAKFKTGETWRVRVVLSDGQIFEIDLKFTK